MQMENVNGIKIVGRGSIHARVARIGRVSQRVEREIHVLAVSIMVHTVQHGDYTAGEALLNAMPRGLRVKALAFWFKNFSNNKLTFSLAKEGDRQGQWVGKLDKDRTEGDFALEQCAVTSFADLTNEKEPVTVTVESLIKMLRNKAANAELNDDGSPKVDPRARDVASKLLKFVEDNRLAA
jgi:hypothetical protein